MSEFDAIIIGAGAAGLMCAITAGGRGRKILLLDHADKIGEKIRISGGGRCNFTNLNATAENYISQNPRFCISALKRYRPENFVAMVERHEIKYFEKTLGQLFCQGPATQIVEMLLGECRDAGVEIKNPASVKGVIKNDNGYRVTTDSDEFNSASVVIASGGLSIPKIGASDFGQRIAREFGLNVIPTNPALVPLTFSGAELENMKNLAGVSLDVKIGCNKTIFSDALLFTHRGLSGPAILQISSYWNNGDEIIIDMAPGTDTFAKLKTAKQESPKQLPQTILSRIISKRLAQSIVDEFGLREAIGQISDKTLFKLGARINDWRVRPTGSEGYRTAEVTIGGVDTDEISSKTMEAKKAPGLFFIGEVVDVTGQLGGYNFQWAWASGFAAGSSI